MKNTTNAPEITQTFNFDGKSFATKAAAVAYQRKPDILEAILSISESTAEMAEWLFTNQDDVKECLSSVAMKRATKMDKNKLRRGIELAEKLTEENATGSAHFAFLIENKEDIVAGFRWPGQKRLTPEEKQVSVVASLDELNDNNTELSEWIFENSDAIVKAFNAGKPAPNQAATDGLAAYQAKRKAEKLAAAEAAEADEANPE
jgi:dsDNA-binding SOS-regulon protein